VPLAELDVALQRAVSHLPMLFGGVTPSTIQARHVLALSWAHQMSFDLAFESGPRIGYRKV